MERVAPVADRSGGPAERDPSGALVVEHLSWRPHGRVRTTLTEVTLRVTEGERVLLVGASGSGKSTLLRAAAGLLDDSLGELTGQVSFDGRPPQDRPGQVGLLLQDPTHSLVAEYAGRDAAFGPENLAAAPAEIRHRAAQALSEVGFPYPADHHTTALSGGETQRLALAGALALSPRVLLLDEPTAMLDQDSAATIRGVVSQVVDARRLGLVVVEHRLAGWVDVCDRLVVLGPSGTVLADGATDRVLTERRDELLDWGIWVPGAPDPSPRVLHLPAMPGADRRTVAARSRNLGSSSGAEPVARASTLGIDAPGGTRRLVDNLELSVRQGEMVAITGPSGAGKSTLLRTVLGLHRPVTGQVALSDGGRLRPVADLVRNPARLAASAGLLLQHAERSVVRRTVTEEVLATSHALFADDQVRLDGARRRADAALSALGLDHLRDADPFQISGGEQRRMALAAVISHAPRLLVADEPTVGQDRQTWAAVQGVLAAARSEGTGVLLSTHDQSLIAGVDRRIDLAGADEPPQTADHRLAPVVEPGTPPAGRINPLAGLITGLGAVVGSFFIDDWATGLLSLVLVALLTPLAVRRPRTLVRLLPVGLAALTVGWSTLLFGTGGWWQLDRWPTALREALRICYLVIPGALILATLRPSALADALGQRLRLPPRVVVAAAAGLLRLDGLFEEWRELGDVRRVRGLAPGRAPTARARHLASMTLALLVSMLRSAQQMATSMDARGFAAAQRRSYALDSPWRGRDWCAVVLGVILLAAPACLAALLKG